MVCTLILPWPTIYSEHERVLLEQRLISLLIRIDHTAIDLDFFAGFLNVELPTYLPFSHGLSFECVVDSQKHKVIPSAVKPKPVEKVSLKD